MAFEFHQETSVDDAATSSWQIAETGDTERLEEVCEHGADINAVNSEGVTALMRAASQGRTELVEALVKSGADINVKRADGFTALTLAAFFGHKEVAQFLVEHGADLNLATRFGTSAEMWASARCFQELADYLRQARCSNCAGEAVSTTDENKEPISTAASEAETGLSIEDAEFEPNFDETTIETQPVRSLDLEDDEHAWIAKSTGAGGVDQSFIDEWSAPELTSPPPVNFSVDEDQHEGITGSTTSTLEGDGVVAERSAPELTPPPVDLKDSEANGDEEIAGSDPSTSEARTAVDDLRKPSIVVPVLGTPSAVPVQSRSFAVHSLKNPPEIWEQVRVQPTEFHPAVALLAQVTANNRQLMMVTLAVMFVCGVGTYEVLKLRQFDRENIGITQARSEHRMEPPATTIGENATTPEGKRIASAPTAGSSDSQPVKTSTQPKSSTASADSPKDVADNKKPGVAETEKNSVKRDSDSKHRNADVTTASSVANKRKDSSTRDVRPTSKSSDIPARKSETTKRSEKIAVKSEITRKSVSAPATNVGDGETRPRMVTQQAVGAKVSMSSAAQNSQRQSSGSNKIAESRPAQNRPDNPSTKVIAPASKSTTPAKAKVIPWP